MTRVKKTRQAVRSTLPPVISPEMIEAGEAILREALSDADLPSSAIVTGSAEAVYIAMTSALFQKANRL